MRERVQRFEVRQTMRNQNYEIFHYNQMTPEEVTVHHHDFYEVFFFLGGKVTYRAEGQIYHLKPGDILLINPMVLHQPIIASDSPDYERIILWVDRGYLEKLAGGRTITAVIVDPSAASFIEVLKRKGWRVLKANNDVLSGIRLTSDYLKQGKVVICQGCGDCLREMEEYVWDLSSGSKDKVRKEHDHAMDDMRYFVSTVLGEKPLGFAACTVERKR